MSYPSAIRRENEYLARELGNEHGKPRYQWAWSEDLQMPMVMLDEESKTILDYHCFCGVNVAVHSAACKFTVPRKRWQMRKLAPNKHDQWILCRWMPPEASRDDWESMFGTTPYPTEGHLVPVGDPEKCIALAPGQVPYRQSSELIVCHIKEHFTKTGAQRNKELEDHWIDREAKKKEDLRLQCIDAFPVHTGFPGDREEWSHGGMPDVPSPNLRPKSDIVIASA